MPTIYCCPNQLLDRYTGPRIVGQLTHAQTFLLSSFTITDTALLK